jgi:cytochrome c biogenesis protein CcdA
MLYGLIIFLIGVYFIVHFFLVVVENINHMRNDFKWHDWMPIILGIVLIVMGLFKIGFSHLPGV